MAPPAFQNLPIQTGSNPYGNQGIPPQRRQGQFSIPSYIPNAFGLSTLTASNTNTQGVQIPGLNMLEGSSPPTPVPNSILPKTPTGNGNGNGDDDGATEPGIMAELFGKNSPFLNGIGAIGDLAGAMAAWNMAGDYSRGVDHQIRQGVLDSQNTATDYNNRTYDRVYAAGKQRGLSDSQASSLAQSESSKRNIASL